MTTNLDKARARLAAAKADYREYREFLQHGPYVRRSLKNEAHRAERREGQELVREALAA